MNRRAFLCLAAVITLPQAAYAGAWGTDSFENDAAADWARDCAATRDAKLVFSALSAAIKNGYLEAPEASAAVAAAEVVAAALGRASAKLPGPLARWVEGQPKEALTNLAPLAQKAVARILGGPQSELRELWMEGPGRYFPAWEKGMKELLARLK